MSKTTLNPSSETFLDTGYGKDALYENDAFEHNNADFEEDVAENDDATCEEVMDLRPKRGAPVQYPTSKPGHYSKDRRHVPIQKKSDADKKHVRSGNGKGAKHKKKVAFSTP